MIAACVCVALVAALVGAVNVFLRQRERWLLDMEPQSGPAPLAEPVGYSGEATLTGVSSPHWSRGVATAWRIDEKLDNVFPEYDARLAVEDGRLYVVTLSSVRAYDVSGPQPTLLWSSPHVSNGFAMKPVVWGDRLVVGVAVFSTETGQELASLPTEIEGSAVGVVDSVLLVCGGLAGECTGVDASFKKLWTTRMPDQLGEIVFQATRAGGRSWIHLGSSDYVQSHTIVEARTGTEATLALEKKEYSRISPAANGWLVGDRHRKVFMTAEADGTPRQTFNPGVNDPAASEQPIVPGGEPTVEQWERYFGDGDASWALGVLGATGEECRTLTFGDSSVDLISHRVRSAHGHFNGDEADPCRVKAPSSASPDASVLFYSERRKQSPGGLPEEVERFYFVALKEGYLVRLDPSQDVRAGVWAYDDLYVGVTPRGIVAITPRGA